MLWCVYCEEEVPHREQIRKETYQVKGKDIEVDAVVSFCKKCGREIWNEKEDSKTIKRVLDLYKERYE